MGLNFFVSRETFHIESLLKQEKDLLFRHHVWYNS